MKQSCISDFVRKSVLALCLGLLPLTASATAIIDNGLYSTDDDTGLDWLDLTETAGMSFNDVSAQLGTGGTFEGWSYASPDQVNTLINNMLGTSGVSYNGGWNVTNWVIVFDILPLLGDLSGQYDSFGISRDLVNYPDNIVISALVDNPSSNPGLNEDYIRVYNSVTQGFDYANTDTGSFLIRGSGGQNLVLGSPPSPPSGSVPGPATFPLLLLGLAVLALQRRRSPSIG